MEPFPFDSENFNESNLALYKEVFHGIANGFKKMYKKIARLNSKEKVSYERVGEESKIPLELVERD